METELTGISDVMSKLSHALSKAGGLTKEGMQDVLNDIWQRAADKAPKDTGNLRGSGSMWVEDEGESILGEVRFNEKYAAIQHERLDFKHEQGEAKYLEKAMIEKLDQVRDKIAASLNDVFGGV